MKHFLIEITYLVSAEQLGDVVAEHRAFLQTGYDRGWLLFSGPLVPRTGGVVVGRADAGRHPGFFQERSLSAQGPGRLPLCRV
jgi:uncharacterized protein YciI